MLEVKPYSYCPKSTTVKISTHGELLSMAELRGYVICSITPCGGFGHGDL